MKEGVEKINTERANQLRSKPWLLGATSLGQGSPQCPRPHTVQHNTRRYCTPANMPVTAPPLLARLLTEHDNILPPFIIIL